MFCANILRVFELPIFRLSDNSFLRSLHLWKNALDKILIQRKLVTTRTRAEKIIREVGVKVDGKLIHNQERKFLWIALLKWFEEEIPWVSRGALKLIEALDEWKPEIENGTFMDIGASTGGFTQVLLDRKAAKVYCVDVGTAQLHEKIKTDDKTINLEKTHVRELTPKLIQDPIDGCVVDVSFISLEKILPFIHSFHKRRWMDCGLGTASV